MLCHENVEHLHDRLSFIEYNYTISLIDKQNEKFLLLHQDIHKKKLPKLLADKVSPLSNHHIYPDKVICYFSARVLTEKHLLCKG